MVWLSHTHSPSLVSRLRDVSNEEKAEHQLVVKELEKQTQTLATAREQKNRLDEELKVIQMIQSHDCHVTIHHYRQQMN